jgi:chemotaxis protein CheD
VTPPRDPAVARAIHADAGPGPTVFLHPGQLHVGGCGLVTTILGSCVAVCLFDAARRLGGMNHFLLPFSSREASARYGDHAMPQLLGRMLAAGARRASLEARVFGGASVIPAFRGRALGADNVAIALQFLEAQEIPIVDTLIGGERGLKLRFDVGTGDVHLKLL